MKKYCYTTSFTGSPDVWMLLYCGSLRRLSEHQVSVTQIALNSNLSNINKRLLNFFCKPVMFRCRFEKLLLSILFKFRDDSSSWFFKIKCVKEIFIWIYTFIIQYFLEIEGSECGRLEISLPRVSIYLGTHVMLESRRKHIKNKKFFLSTSLNFSFLILAVSS